ncbi:sensor histidine kinase [Nocardiopsis coralliicola]
MTTALDRLRAASGAAWTPAAARRLLVDVPLALVIAAGASFAARFAGAGKPDRFGPPGPPGPPDFGPADVGAPTWAAIAVLALAVAVRRVYPRTAFAAACAGTAVFIGGTGIHGPILAALLLTGYALGAALPIRAWAPWTAAVLPVLVAANIDRPYAGLFDPAAYAAALPYVALLAAAIALGATVRGRRVTARRERELELRRSASEERLRIAREVHDLVGHSLSVISMQAGVALHVLDRRPDRVRESLEAIRSTSGDALDELRATLAVFRDGGDPRGTATEGAAVGAEAGGAAAPAEGAGSAPPPGLDRVAALAARIEAAGPRIAVQTEGEPAVPPAAVDHAAYRIVQEALTNVVRHGGGAGARVRIAYGPTEVAVDIENDGVPEPGAHPAEGSGIAGMRERARAAGGNLHAGPRPQGGFAVRALLPLRAPEGRR